MQFPPAEEGGSGQRDQAGEVPSVPPPRAACPCALALPAARAGEGAVDKLRSRHSRAVGLPHVWARGCWRPRSGWVAGRRVGRRVGSCSSVPWTAALGAVSGAAAAVRLRARPTHGFVPGSGGR